MAVNGIGGRDGKIMLGRREKLDPESVNGSEGIDGTSTGSVCVTGTEMEKRKFEFGRKRRWKRKFRHYLETGWKNQARVPKFGNWESGDNIPYTKYFDNARMGKTAGMLINPNDPQENLESIAQDTPVCPSPLRTVFEPETARIPKNSGMHRPTDYPSRKAPSDSLQQQYRYRRAIRKGGGSELSFEQSPLHPNYQPKGGSKVGVNSPSWERKGAQDGTNTTGRARGRQGSRGNETPGKGSAVPKFGEWDESDPASSDGYTHIFNQVREERHDGSARVPSPLNQSSYRSNQKPDSYYDESKGCCCCFSFLK